MLDYARKTDNELVLLAQEKDNFAFAEIVKRYQNKLLRYAGYLMNNNDGSWDVVQNSFIKSYINLNSYKANKKFSTWLYRIVHNEAINELKKYHRETPLLPDVDFASEESIEEDFSAKEIKEKISKCLGQAPIKYSEPLSLYYLEEKTYEEISDILRLPINTIGTRISRAKKIMKKICQKMN